jgi:type I restriction enzyme, S subunit
VTRVEELIEELAPEGVKYIELQSLFDTRNGYTPSKSDASLWAAGTVPWFRMEDVRENGGVLAHSLQYIPETAVKGGLAKLFPANSILVATSATIGVHALITVPHMANQRFTSLSLKPQFNRQFEMKFIYYYCFVLDEWCQKNATVSSFASVDMAGFRRFRFPMPPLEVQREIVRILDNFTELEAELEAELDARRRQYVFFRDQLLDAGPVARKELLGDVLSLRAGKFISASQIQAESDTDHPYPCFGGNGIRGFVADWNHDGEYVLIGRQGALSGNVKRTTGKFYATEHALVVNPIEQFDTAWLFHALLAMNLNQYVSNGAQPGLAVTTLNRVSIAVPDYSEQARIGQSLDKFDALVNDLNIGLPAELAARRKQYEYYRDKLLTFEEAPA